jgi:pimeloyl-ACP methyl ester carboxylesterase
VTNSLILVPGVLCNGTVWEHQAAALAGLADVHIAELAHCDSLGAMGDALLATAPAQFAIAGHSMGGRVALEVLRRAPRRIQGLALLDSGFEPLQAGERGEREAQGRLRMVARARELGMHALGIAWLQGMVLPARLADEMLVDKILTMIEQRTPDYYESQTRAMLTRPDAGDVLASIDYPTLVLCGRQDSWSPLDRHRRMASLIAGSRLAIIEECGHMSTLERPEAVTHELLTWLAEVFKDA